MTILYRVTTNKVHRASDIQWANVSGDTDSTVLPVELATSASLIKSINTLIRASIKSINGLAIASVKSRLGLT